MHTQCIQCSVFCFAGVVELVYSLPLSVVTRSLVNGIDVVQFFTD